MLGTTIAPTAFSTSSPIAPNTAPGSKERHGTRVFGRTRNAQSQRPKLTSTLTTSVNGLTGPGNHRTNVEIAEPATNNTAAPASHAIPMALSFTPRSSTCHTWLKTYCNAATNPSDDQTRPS